VIGELGANVINVEKGFQPDTDHALPLLPFLAKKNRVKEEFVQHVRHGVNGQHVQELVALVTRIDSESVLVKMDVVLK